MLSFMFVIVYVLFECKRICAGVYRLLIYVFSLVIQLPGMEGWFNRATFMCLSQARTWISNVICCGFFVFGEMREDCSFLSIIIKSFLFVYSLNVMLVL